MQGRLLGDSKALLVLGLGTLEPNMLGDDLVGQIAAGRDEVASRSQVSIPERFAQVSSILEEMVGMTTGAHSATTREVGLGEGRLAKWHDGLAL